MERSSNTAGAKILENIKVLIRPFYRSIQQFADWLTPDKPSSLALGTFDGFTLAYRKGTADELVVKHSFDNDIFFAGVPEYHPAETDTIIEIGAHIGTFSILAATKVPRGRVYAIEPSEDSANYLHINVALNRCDNVSVHQVAISDQGGTANLYHDTGTWGHSTVMAYSEASETVPATSLSAFMDANHIDHCDFMKLNCEGAEFPILLGSPKEILGRFEMMLVLYHCDLWQRNTEEDLLAHLASAGFHCTIRNKTNTRGWIIAARDRQKTLA